MIFMANIIRRGKTKKKTSTVSKNKDSKAVNEINGKTTKTEGIKLTAEYLNIEFHVVWEEKKESDISVIYFITKINIINIYLI
jgi:hypothetical protein